MATSNAPLSFESGNPSIAPATLPPNGPQYPGPAPLTFGSVAFNSEECPSRLPIGPGEQKKSVTELIGGGRIVQVYGAQPQPVTFSGTFWNVNVAPRVMLLRSYNVAGSEQLLTWNFEKYYGILTKFEPNYHNVNRCEYTISIEITRDANGSFSSTSPTSVDSQVAVLQNNSTVAYGQLLSLSAIFGDDGPAAFQQNWNNEQLAIQQGYPLSQATPQISQNITNSVQALTAQIRPYIAALGSIDPRIIPATQFLNNLNLIASNVQQGQAPRTIQVMGGSLATIAAKYYGDVSLAVQLMQANGLSIPHLPSGLFKTIILPPFPRAA